MNIKHIIGAAVTAGTLLTSIVACKNQDEIKAIESRRELLTELMADRPQEDINTIKYSYRSYMSQHAESQWHIDTLVFRNMFLGSQQVKSPKFIADYEKLIKETKCPISTSSLGMYGNANAFVDNEAMVNKIKNALTVKEWNKISQDSIMVTRDFWGIGKQYLVDSIYWHKFLDKHNLLNGENLQKFHSLCKKVRP